MSALRAILGLSPNGQSGNDPDGHALRAQIDEEFAHHLDERARDIERTEGVPPKTARELARARFGDAHKIARQCERIATWEKTMLQRLNAALSVLLLIGLISVGWLAWTQNRATSETLAEVGASIEQLREQLGAAPSEGSEKPATTPGYVYMSGGFLRSGVYQLATNGTTLEQVMIAAGGPAELNLGEQGPVVSVRRQLPNGSQSVVLQNSYANVIKSEMPFVLQPDDMVSVEEVEVVAKDGYVYVEGDVNNPGSVRIPPEGLTLERAIRGAGGFITNQPNAYWSTETYKKGPLVTVRRGDEHGRDVVLNNLYDLARSFDRPFIMEPNDIVQIDRKFMVGITNATDETPESEIYSIRGAVKKQGRCRVGEDSFISLGMLLSMRGYFAADERVDVDVIRGTGAKRVVHEFEVTEEMASRREPLFRIMPGDDILVYERGRTETGELDQPGITEVLVQYGENRTLHLNEGDTLAGVLRSCDFDIDNPPVLADPKAWEINVESRAPNGAMLSSLQLSVAQVAGASEQLQIKHLSRIIVVQSLHSDKLVAYEPYDQERHSSGDGFVVERRMKSGYSDKSWVRSESSLPIMGYLGLAISKPWDDYGRYGKAYQKLILQRADGTHATLNFDSNTDWQQLDPELLAASPGDTIIFEEL